MEFLLNQLIQFFFSQNATVFIA